MHPACLPCVLFLIPQSSGSDAAAEFLRRSREHYATVERELVERDVSHLTAGQLQARLQLIAALAAYRECGDFTRNPDFPGSRVPYFVDHEGRLCAVATLLHATGEDELVRRVAATNNHVWVSELAGDEGFEGWLARVGLGFEEAVRIQGPSNGPSATPPAPASPPLEPLNLPTAPTDAATGRPDGPQPLSGGSGPSTPGLGGPTLAPGSSGPSGPTTPMQDPSGSNEGWITWWELNKLRWFERLAPVARPVTGDVTDEEDAGARLRRTVVPRLLAELAHPQAEVRSAAALAYARAAGRGSVEALLALFKDSSRDVRESAILALGVSDSEAGVHALLSILREDDVPTPRAHALALVALGIERMHGRGQGTDAMLARMLDALEGSDGDDLRHAAMLHQSLAPSSELSARVRCATGRFEEECEQEGVRVWTRARALEALRFDGQPSFVLPRLLDAVHGRALEERRSAACALAELRGALDALLTAHELEEDEFTRGLLLLSIGDQGGERARSFLEERLERGRKSERPWAALALGILAGDEWDDEARSTLRAAHARAGKSERDAIVLAMGLARDEGAHEVLVQTLASSKSDRSRMFAAVALGLIGGEEGHAVLTHAIGELSCPYARSGVALALARYGDPGDVERLVGLLRAERRPESLRDLALALGLEAAPGTAGALLALLDQDPPAAVRAAALDALGLALASDASLAAIALGQTSNYAAWPDWVRSLLQRPL